MKLPSNYPFTISPEFGDVHFVDLLSLNKIAQKSLSVDELTYRFFSIEIPFVDWLFRLRCALVKPFGLKGDSLPKQAPVFVRKYNVGEQIVIFTVASRTHNEIVLEDEDKHLNFRIYNIIKHNDDGTLSYHNSTVVHYNNVWGRIYFFFVRPFHTLIVLASMHKLSKQMRTL